MKKSIILFAAAAIVCACSYEPAVKTGEPSVTFDAESLSGYPGETITVTGTAADPAGLSAISLQVQDWAFLKNTDLSKGSPASYSFSADVVIPESASGSATFTATAVSAVSGVATASIEIALTEMPVPVVDTEAPVITMDSPAEAEVGVPYTFSLTFSDDVGIIECWPKWHITMGWTTYPTVDGEAYNTDGYSVTVSGQSTKVSHTLVFPSAGEYDVIVYDSSEGVSDGIHTLERADDWSIATFKITVTGEVDPPQPGDDTQAPVLTLLSSDSAVVGEDYVLSFKVEDETALVAGTVSVTVWGNFDPWPKPLDGAVLTIEEGVKEATFISSAFKFTSPGEYKVWMGAISDGTNQIANADVFTINVTGESAPPAAGSPEVKMTSAATAQVGVAYTLTIDFTAPKGFAENWPKVSCWGDFDPWPTPLSNDFFTLPSASTSYTYSKEITFTAAGTYVVGVYTDSPLLDTEENEATIGQIATIAVSE